MNDARLQEIAEAAELLADTFDLLAIAQDEGQWEVADRFYAALEGASRRDGGNMKGNQEGGEEMTKRIITWGPRSHERPEWPDVNDHCPKCEGRIVRDERNRRDECEVCGQPMKRHRMRQPPVAYD
ncbi:MAG: hypothetical protein ABR529_15750 [Actinomycetota bacterium]